MTFKTGSCGRDERDVRSRTPLDRQEEVVVKSIEKRRRVMDRSIRLGHCICDPRLPCPCDLLTTQDVCLCAGERIEPQSGPVRLTRLVEKAGCASKIDQLALKQVLAGLPQSDDPRVIVGVPAGDDAGVFRLDDGQAWVQTVDVFSPSVDDPYTFGQIAAANSVSDIYAMGARPLTALSIVGFPIREMPDRVLHDILRGGIDKMTEAGVSVIGGHSINDREIKAGFAVTGLVDADRIVTSAGARPGDLLVLTKPIGTGIIAFADQIRRADEGAVEAAAASMAALNRAACELMLECGAHACTDVTGFGLMGHLANMGSASGVDLEIAWDDIPVLPGVLECLARGIVPGAVERNRESSADRMRPDPKLTNDMLDLCFDPQTSGGLLIALPADRARSLLSRLREAGVSEAAVIGRVLGPGAGSVDVRWAGIRGLPDVQGASASSLSASSPPKEARQVTHQDDEVPCCADAVEAQSASGTSVGGVDELQRRFQEFLAAVNRPGALDAATKQAIAVALSLLAECEPCLRMHIRKAREKGFSEAEIDEAAWMAISFGGAPLMVWYNEVKRDC
jgi:selenide,water dikinase